MQQQSVTTTLRLLKGEQVKNVPYLNSILSRRDRAMSGLLTGVVVVLVVCHIPKTIINLSESYHLLRYGEMIQEKEEPLWGKIVIKFSHLLLTLSSAINIIIYSYKVGRTKKVFFTDNLFQDFKFRAVLRTLCGHHILDRLSHEESIKENEGQLVLIF